MRKVLSIILATVLLLGVMPVVSFATEIVASGTCGENGDNLTWTLDNEGTLIISGTGEMANSSWINSKVIKTAIIENGVTNIGDQAFYFCSNLTSVVIPESVTQIGVRAFAYCNSLLNVTIPDRVMSIGEKAFYYCPYLSNITIPFSVTDIGYHAFDYGAPVGAVESKLNIHLLCYKGSAGQTYAENNNTAYGLIDGTEEENTFSGTTGRMSWTIDRLNCILSIDCVGVMPTFATAAEVPWRDKSNYVHKVMLTDGLLSISSFAFYGCSHMTEISIPDSVTSIGYQAFHYCDNLKTLVLPDNLENIGRGAFEGCADLNSVIIPDNVTIIQEEVFRNCYNLEEVTIPNGVERIGSSSFCDCRALRSIVIPENVKSIEGYAFSGCSSLISVIISGNKCKVFDSAFSNCSSLIDLTIIDGVQMIYSSFSSCTSLTSVELPASVNSVRSGAFKNCVALESVYFYNPNCTIEAGATPANTTVYGYSGSTAETYADENGLLFMEIDGHEHHFTVTKAVEPTCTVDGYKNLSCPCGERKTETIPATGHTEIIVPAKAATCTEGGYEAWSYCEVCGEPLTEKVETEATGHTPVTAGAISETCGKEGFSGITYCSVCREVLDLGEAIPATGAHTTGTATETVLTEATCTAAGEKTITVKCSVCGETLSETAQAIPALGHADADGDGLCDRCNASLQTETPPQPEQPQQSGNSKSHWYDWLVSFFKMLLNLFKS